MRRATVYFPTGTREKYEEGKWGVKSVFISIRKEEPELLTIIFENGDEINFRNCAFKIEKIK